VQPLKLEVIQNIVIAPVRVITIKNVPTLLNVKVAFLSLAKILLENEL
jgi:hypothetical protein